MELSDNGTVVFAGFLNLPNLEKLSVIEAINEYFDSNDREPIRAECNFRFEKLSATLPDWKCICCGADIPVKNAWK